MSSSKRWTAGATVEQRKSKTCAWKGLILRAGAGASSEAKDEGVCTSSIRDVLLSRSSKKNLRVHPFNRKFTDHPQVFHT